MKLTEKVFLGFQFKSQYYSKSTLENLLVDSVTEVSTELKENGLDYVALEPQLIDLKPSEGVTEGIIRLIEDSLFCLFEISDNNPNVMFELGNAYAKSKGLIFLKNSESTPINKIPSDIIGKFIVYYGGDDYPSLEKLRPKITKTIKDYVIDRYNKKSETWVRKIWDIKGDNLIVVSGSIHGRYEVEPRDADTLFDSTLGLINLYPGVKAKRFYAIDFPKENFQNNDILVVGGPESNRITQMILESFDPSFPFCYEETDEPYDFILKDKINFREYKKRFEGKELKTDYGFFLKVPSPYVEGRNILIMTGIGADGTLGCSRALPFNSGPVYDYYWSNSKSTHSICMVPSGGPVYKYYYDNFSVLGDKRYFCFIIETKIEEVSNDGKVLKESIDGKVLKETIYYLDQNDNNRWKKL